MCIVEVSEQSFKFGESINGEVVSHNLEIGKWYCGFYFDDNYGEYVSGPLGEYVGMGEFYDGDDEVEMRGCDYLIKQR